MTLPTYLTVPCMISTAVITPGMTTVVIKASAGVVGSMLVTGAGSATTSIFIYDSNVATTSGTTVIGATAAVSTVVGDIHTFNMPASSGITIVQLAANGPTMTISYA